MKGCMLMQLEEKRSFGEHSEKLQARPHNTEKGRTSRPRGESCPDHAARALNTVHGCEVS